MKINSKYILLTIIILVPLFFISRESFQAPLNLAHPTKCVDCERQLPPSQRYRALPTKCFSCERELASKFGPEAAYLGQPSKCFDCEKQMLGGRRIF